MASPSWKVLRADFIDSLAQLAVHARMVDRVWAETRDGRRVAVLAAAENQNARYWLGGSRARLLERRTAGVVLLCKPSRGDVIVIGIDATTLRVLLPRLGVSKRGDVHLNIVPKGARMILQAPGGDDVDLTSRIGDLSWLGAPSEARSVAETASRYEREGDEPAAVAPPHRFFARVESGRLVPTDPMDLPDGAVVLVEAQRVAGAPTSRAMRRIAALRGPEDLPRDFAERHDEYAHGKPR
jgi:hypothetical protein